jgi:predicted amidophosphoribosyltransferase
VKEYKVVCIKFIMPQTCPMCGATLRPDLNYCEVCGADVSIYDQVLQLIMNAQPFQGPIFNQPVPQQPMMQQPVQQPMQQGLVCPNCGQLNPPNAKRCMYCGAELHKHHHFW